MNCLKYYTPKIEEFCIGFEFEEEFNNPNLTKMVRPIGDNYEWVKLTLNTSHSISRITSKIKKQKIRTKYLDKTDIESFGFVEDKSNSDQYRLNLELVKDGYIYGVVLYDTTQVSIYKYKHKEDVIFCGKIKNKTEFKKLLNQVGIYGNTNNK